MVESPFSKPLDMEWDGNNKINSSILSRHMLCHEHDGCFRQCKVSIIFVLSDQCLEEAIILAQGLEFVEVSPGACQMGHLLAKRSSARWTKKMLGKVNRSGACIAKKGASYMAAKTVFGIENIKNEARYRHTVASMAHRKRSMMSDSILIGLFVVQYSPKKLRVGTRNCACFFFFSVP